MFVYHFVNADMRVEIFKNVGVDFEIGDIDASTHLYWSLKKILCIACLLFYHFFGDNINSFDLPSYSSESRKSYTLSLLSMCLDALGKGFSCFPARDWESVSRNLLFLVKL